MSPQVNLATATPAPRSIDVDRSVVDDLEQAAWGVARDDFALYRRTIRPGLTWDWWPQEVSEKLQQFYIDLKAGKRPKMAVMAPPQHGKSLAATDFITYVAGRDPNLKIIYASFSDQLGERTNRDVQRIMRSPEYINIFGRTRLDIPGWSTNTTLIEFGDFKGSFRNTTVEGQINGLELHLGIIDDPHKGRNEALSQSNRDRIWNWFADDWLARFHKDAGMLAIMTRWHVDDMLGRFIERFPEITILRYPAVAEVDEIHVTKLGTHHRKKGEALFPEWKPLDFLFERQKTQTAASWAGEYQQSPIVQGGGILPIDKLKVMPHWAPQGSTEIMASIRFWDKAGTEKGGNYSAGVLMHALRDGRYVISHIARAQWGAYERERNIRQYAEDDARVFTNYEIGLEQEPGSGGKESAENTVRNLAGYATYVDKVTGSKEVRANPFAAMVQNSQVLLIAGDWVENFKRECEAFPNGQYDDQVDACSGGFNRLAQRKKFDSSYAWVG
jgi:predicted phage terminase large subunit-like protein